MCGNRTELGDGCRSSVGGFTENEESNGRRNRIVGDGRKLSECSIFYQNK